MQNKIPAYKQELIGAIIKHYNAGEYTKVDAACAQKMVAKHYAAAKKLADAESYRNEPLFSSADITDILLRCSDTTDFSKKVEAVLDNPEEVRAIEHLANKVAGMSRAVRHPLASTVIKNKELFSEPWNILKESTFAELDEYPKIKKVWMQEHIHHLRTLSKTRQSIKSGISATKNSGFVYIKEKERR